MAAGAQATTLPVSVAQVVRGNRAWAVLRRVGLLLAVVLTIRTFVGEASVVPTGSMQSTILIGDHILLDKALYGPTVPLLGLRLPRIKTVRRGDIVAFRYPKDPEITFLKRVIALGGDLVEIHDDLVYRNGKPLDEPYAQHIKRDQRARGYRESMRPVLVPEGQMFVMGDNRDDSEDSRYFGTVPLTSVVGEPMLIYWSYDAPSSKWLDDDPMHRLKFYGSMLPNLLSHTRWGRVGDLL